MPAFVDFGRQNILLWTVYVLFMHCIYTVHILKNIKNRSHGIIYIFKNYFTTVFLVFSFSNNKFNPNGPCVPWNLNCVNSDVNSKIWKRREREKEHIKTNIPQYLEHSNFLFINSNSLSTWAQIYKDSSLY